MAMMPQTQSSSPGIIPGASGALPIPQIPDHELLRRIGAGSYGEVWLARNHTTGTLRAVKFVHRREFGDDGRPYQREFEGLLKFEPISRSHPSQLAILHVGQDEAAGCFYYLMELADAVEVPRPKSNVQSHPNTRLATSDVGLETLDSRPYAPHTLRSELKQRGALPITRCVEIGLALASALEHLHRQGLVHRDIKPSNIVFVKGVPKLADIGLVTDAGDGRSIVGTEGYLPPEGPGTARADLFSLGKVLYEASTGLDRRQYPQLPPELRARPDAAALIEFNEILLRLCAADAGDRYLTAEELRADLKLLEGGRSVRRKRTVERRVNLAKKLGIGAVALALLMTLLFLSGANHSHTPSPEADRLYILAQWYYNQLTPEAHKLAITYLNQALEADPKFLKPYRELTAIYVWNTGGLSANKEENHRRLKEIADKILATDFRLAEGHAALSYWLFLKQDWRGAEDEIVRAIELDPDYAHARDIYSFYLSMLGRTDEAQRQSERSQELDPTARTTAMVAAWPFMAARQFDKAVAQLLRAVELDKHFPEAHIFLGRCYEAQSNYLAAIEEFKTADLSFGGDADETAKLYARWREAYATTGERGYWQKKIEDLPKLSEDERPAREIAGCYARLGDTGKALDELEMNFNIINRHELKFDPLFDTLRDNPRFQALVRRSGLER